MTLAHPEVLLNQEPQNERARTHALDEPWFVEDAWDLSRSAEAGPFRSSARIVTSSFRIGTLRAWWDWMVGVPFDVTRIVRGAALDSEYVRVATLGGLKLRVPLSAVWGRASLRRSTALDSSRVRHDIFQIGPTFWIVFPTGTPREFIAALDAAIR